MKCIWNSIFALLWLSTIDFLQAAEDGVFVRFRLIQPDNSRYYVKIAGFAHVANWYLPDKIIPANADKKADAPLKSGEFTDWVDLKAQFGKSLHGRHNRAGGIAEFPNVTARFLTEPKAEYSDVEIELATVADPAKTVKRWHESFRGDSTSFLVSPNLTADASQLESATEMTERRLRWAQEATGGVRHSPKNLILQTSFWSPQRPELNLKEAKGLSLLGFNVVGGMRDEVREAFPGFREPGQSHDVPLGPNNDTNDIAKAWQKLGRNLKTELKPGVAYNFQDEVCCRPPLGTNSNALREFRAWLKLKRIPAANLGVTSLDEVMPIETPDAFRERIKTGESAARRIFYYTARFRQHAATERLIWNTEAFHKHAAEGSLSSTLVADHPYFAGTGLGMGFEQQNNAWGGWPLAMDWFDIGRRRAVDLMGIEDWMGLQFMYGPAYTWEGFQLMGFQASIFRSASRAQIPIITWITPSDERNLRLKFASALAQGAKHLFYWTYGPTATSTENYWSDQPGSYPGMAHISRLLQMGEPIIASGKPRRTRVALLYSISSDLWQPFGYIHMLERRALYLALIHDQFLVDFLTEEDLAAGRLSDYRVLYTADPCIAEVAVKAIRDWTKAGGTVVGTCAAGSRNEFGEDSAELAAVFGIKPAIAIHRQPGDYRTRGKLNDIPHFDHFHTSAGDFGLIGLRASVQPKGAKVRGTFASNAAPALLENHFGKGRAVWFAGTPGISYIKDAKFIANALAEKWPQSQRRALTRYAFEAGATPLVKLSEPVIEAGVFDAPEGSALILANFTYTPIKSLQIELPLREKPVTIKSLERGPIEFAIARAASPSRKEGYDWIARFTLPLGLDDLLLTDHAER